MEHLPNIRVIDMTHLVVNHALVSRKEDVIKYGDDENGILNKLYNGRVADPETQKMLQMQLKTVWKCYSHRSTSIIKAKYPEMIQDKNAIKFTR